MLGKAQLFIKINYRNLFESDLIFLWTRLS